MKHVFLSGFNIFSLDIRLRSNTKVKVISEVKVKVNVRGQGQTFGAEWAKLGPRLAEFSKK